MLNKVWIKIILTFLILYKRDEKYEVRISKSLFLETNLKQNDHKCNVYFIGTTITWMCMLFNLQVIVKTQQAVIK